MEINETTIENIVAIPLLPENIFFADQKIIAKSIIHTAAFRIINDPSSPAPKRKLNML